LIENQGPIDELGELVHTNVCRGFSSSQYSLDAPEQFFERKGLWQLVVCAKFEPFHLVFDLVAGREHDDGNVRFSSDLSKRGEAVHTRHHDIEQNEIGGKVFYGTQTVARIGKASSNYKGLVYDAGTGYVGYDENRTYWSYGLEAGYEWDMNESTRLDFAARYRALTLEGFNDRIACDRYEIDDFESHRTHLGLRLNYTGRRGMVPYIGAAWEYEFDSRVRGRAEGLELAEDSLKGSTGVGEIGIKINPSEDSRWTFDGSLKGYIGRTEGVAASLYASYLFD